MPNTVTNLFGEEVPVPQDAPPKRGLDPHQQMLALYGQRRGYTCGRCDHLLRQGRAYDYLKCEKFGITHGPGTDWRARYHACGLFEEAR